MSDNTSKPVKTPVALVIEDEPDLSTLFTTIMRTVGFETKAAKDSKEAMKQLAKTKADVILLDMHLDKDIAGPDLIIKIRSADHLKNTTVVVITADKFTGNQLSGQADFILIKPITMIQLDHLARRLYKNLTQPE